MSQALMISTTGAEMAGHAPAQDSNLCALPRCCRSERVLLPPFLVLANTKPV